MRRTGAIWTRSSTIVRARVSRYCGSPLTSATTAIPRVGQRHGCEWCDQDAESYGAFVANRYKDRKNIIWMLGGDKGTSGNPFTSNETTVERPFITGLKSVTGQQRTQYAAEWASNSYGDEQVDFGSLLTLNGVYSFGGNTATWARTGYADSPTKPTFLLEEPYDEEGPDGTNKNPSAPQPVRRFVWWAMLNSGTGYVAGNGYLIHFFSGYTAHFSTQGHIDLAMLNTFWKSIPWYQLVPSRLGGMKTIVVSGRNSPSRSDYVAAAATPSGTWLLSTCRLPTAAASRST